MPLRNIGGSIGSAIHNVGTALGNPLPDWNISESLQSWGGAPANQPFVYVPPTNQARSGQVQGVSTGAWQGPIDTRNTSGSTVRPPTGSSGAGIPAPSAPPAPSGPSVQDALAGYRNTANSTFNALEGQLDPWRQQSEGYINEQHALGMQDIQSQQQAGMDQLGAQRQRVETNQVRNLKDLANAISQSYNTFSNQLGVMGAGDSSAANVMLPYALSRMEAQQRGGINRASSDAYSGIDDRETQLGHMVTQETNKLNQARMSEMSRLADWFNNARMQVTQMRGNAARAMAENVLQEAINRARSIEDQYAARQNSLRDWATSVSQNVSQLGQNLQAVSNPALLGTLPQFQGVNSTMGGVTPTNYSAPVGFGTGREDDRLM